MSGFASPGRRWRCWLLALATACSAAALGPAAASAAQPVEHLLDEGEAALAAGRLDAVAAALAALQPAVADATGAVSAGALGRWHLLQGRLASERAEISSAAGHYAQARSVLEAAGLTQTARFAAVLMGQAHAWRHLRAPGGLDKAAEALDAAAALLAQLELAQSVEMTELLNQRAVLAYARQDLPGSVAATRAEIAMMRALGLGDSVQLLDAHATLGAVLAQLGQPGEAEQALREGLRLIELHPGQAPPAAVLGVLNNLSAVQADRGQNLESLATAERAVETAAQTFGPGAARSLTPLMRRGNALARLARYGEAREAFEQALVVATTHQASAGPLRRLQLQDGLASVLTVLGDGAAARRLIDQGLSESTSVASLDYWRGRMLRRRAAMAAREQQWPQAEADFAEAMRLIGPVIGERNPYLLDIGSARCFVQSQGGLPGQACAEVAASLGALRDAGPSFRFNAQAALATDAERRGLADDALLHHLRALAAAETGAAPDPLWSAYAALAQHLRARGLRPTAVLLGKQAVEQIERMRASLGADAGRFERGFLFDKLGVYRRLADWLTEDGRIDEALGILRLLKQEEFLDFVNRDGGALGRTEAGPGYAPGYSDPERAVWPRWQADGDVAGAVGVAGAVQREAGRVARLLEQIDREARAPVAATGAAASVAAIRERRVAPPAGELWVWLYPGQQRLNLVLDAPTSREVATVDASPAEAAAAVIGLLAAIERREPVLARLQALHAKLGAPVERAAVAAKATRIVLMVDGALRYLPFAALHDGRDFIGARYSVEQRVPAAPLQAAPRRPPAGPAAAWRVSAMGVTRALSGMAALDAVSGEICSIVAGPVQGLAADDPACGSNGAGRGVLPGAGFVNAAFTASRLEDSAADSGPLREPRAGILHIGTHFVLRPGRISRSWLLLGDGQRMTLDALGRLDFRRQSLVTLSACETGLGGADGSGSGEEIDGLGGLLLRRGAGAVVASLWRVDDASTSRLMRSFYRQLAAGASLADALRRAQATLRAGGGTHAHPFHWAGFYLVTAAR